MGRSKPSTNPSDPSSAHSLAEEVKEFLPSPAGSLGVEYVASLLYRHVTLPEEARPIHSIIKQKAQEVITLVGNIITRYNSLLPHFLQLIIYETDTRVQLVPH